jgi:Flp pilus assembly protein CpaB
VPSTAQKPPRQNRDVRQVLSTRGGSAAVAGVTALLAGLILLVFLAQYRHSVSSDNKSATVLVAQRLIQKGSSGDVIATQGLYQSTRLKKSQLKTGAISDPGAIRGKVAAADILPGQQLTAHEFTKTADTIDTKLSGFQRAISLPLSSAQGMIGDVHTGDRVDVIGAFNVTPNGTTSGGTPVARVLLQNILVLRAPAARAGGGVGGGSTKNVVLQVPDNETAQLAFASQNGQIWLVDRAKAGAKNSTPGIVTLDTIIFGSKPVSPQQSRAVIRNLAKAGGH